ncbi:PaaI family thioesterase [Novispirillum sp. DQ9]|uniref:PaaI family thioesterase n=1 Tax=Novispirillum sp. DQ9 TaxID=3398612 RepID=UPI003C7D1240
MTDYFGLDVPFLRYCAIRAVDRGDGWTLSAVDLEPHHMNSHGSGHGGLIMTLLDVAMGSAARLSEPSSTGVITLNLQTTFLRPATGRVLCQSRVRSRTARTVYCDADVTDAQGSLLAHGTATFMLVTRDTA